MSAAVVALRSPSSRPGIPVFTLASPRLASLLRPQASRPRFGKDGEFLEIIDSWRPSPIDESDAVELRAELERLERHLAPAGRAELLGRVFALLAHYPAEDRPKSLEQALAADWAEDLAEYPLWAVEEAARRWRRDGRRGRFRPSIGEIRDLADMVCERDRTLYSRLRALLEAAFRSEPKARQHP